MSVDLFVCFLLAVQQPSEEISQVDYTQMHSWLHIYTLVMTDKVLVLQGLHNPCNRYIRLGEFQIILWESISKDYNYTNRYYLQHLHTEMPAFTVYTIMQQHIQYFWPVARIV